MFLADDIVLFPMRGLLFVFKEIHEAVAQEIENESQTIRNRLSELYVLLESGQISEDEFAAEEGELLDRLDEIESGEDEDEEPEEEPDEQTEEEPD